MSNNQNIGGDSAENFDLTDDMGDDGDTGPGFGDTLPSEGGDTQGETLPEIVLPQTATAEPVVVNVLAQVLNGQAVTVSAADLKDRAMKLPKKSTAWAYLHAPDGYLRTHPATFRVAILGNPVTEDGKRVFGVTIALLRFNDDGTFDEGKSRAYEGAHLAVLVDGANALGSGCSNTPSGRALQCVPTKGTNATILIGADGSRTIGYARDTKVFGPYSLSLVIKADGNVV